MRLAAVVVGSVPCLPNEIPAHLAAHWKPTFEQTHFDFDAAGTSMLLESHGTKLTMENIPPPQSSAFASFLSRATSSTLGPDGIRYAGWRFGGESANEGHTEMTR